MQSYFDRRENRVKLLPDCARYGLTWVESEQRCNHLDCVEQIMNVVDYQQGSGYQLVDDFYWYHDLYQSGENEVRVFWQDVCQRNWRGVGFLPGDTSGGSGLPLPGFDPISSIVGGLTGVIGGLISGAKQRGTDEARSGVALQASVDTIFYLQDAVMSGDITKKEARDAFYLKVLPAFLNFISTLQTKSVVDSRLKNQRQDLIDLFESQVMSLPDYAKVAGEVAPKPAVASPAEEEFGYTEYYDDDGGYYYEDSNGYYYEDAAGNYQQGDSEGNLYAGTTDGEYWEINVDGESYYESPDGSFYLEYADGSWTSGDALGVQCDGDAAGNYTCEDGTSGGDWRESPVRVAKQTGQTRRQGQITQQSQFDKLIKQAIALIPKQQRLSQNAQRSQNPRALNQVANAQERMRSAGSRGPDKGGAGGLGMNTLLIIGLAVGALFLFRN